MRCIFMGTPLFARHVLQAMCDAGFVPAAVWTQPPRPSGRGMKLTPSPVHEYAAAQGIAVHHPVSFKKEPQSIVALQDLQPDVIMTAAYGLLLPQAVLDAPRLACLNVHGSLLPRWRGAAPIQRAIEAGDADTGITLMHMSAGLDEGDMALIDTVPINMHTTTQQLHDTLAQVGATLAVQALHQLAQGQSLPRVPQPAEGVTYAAKITSGEALLSATASAVVLQRRIRALAPMVYVLHRGERVKILAARVADENTPADALVWHVAHGALEILSLQRAGRTAVTGIEFARAYGSVLQVDDA